MKHNDIQTISEKKSKRKIILMTAISIFNVASLTAGTFAWFAIFARQSTLQVATGDLTVNINKISAYKYVYPFYETSTEFVNYNGEGKVTKYVLQDSAYDSYKTTSQTCTISLGTLPGSVSSVENESHTPTNIYHPGKESLNFRYYLLGDDIFNGIDNHQYDLSVSHPFSSLSDVSLSKSVSLDNVVVSEGSSLMLFDSYSVEGNSCTYLTYNSIAEENSCFSISENKITCLETGIYSFEYKTGSLIITTRSRNDASIIGNNSMDPTLITVDYVGSADKNKYATLNSYVPTAIQNQNTMVILDIELQYNIKHDVKAELKIVREPDDLNQSIIKLPSKYADTEHHLVGYQSEEERNALRASDFYSFFAVFSKTAGASQEQIYQAMHYPTDLEDNNNQPVFNKFPANGEFKNSLDCNMVLKENNDSLIITPEDQDTIYHCYIGIEYDYEYSRYFLNEKRLGNTYLLDRDFGFYFTSTQVLENES